MGCERTAATRDSHIPQAQYDSTDGPRNSPISFGALQAALPGQGLAVDVIVQSLAVRGDTVGIAYVLYIRPESRDSLAEFAVDAPAGVKTIPNPQPITDWWVSPTYKGRNIALWASLGALPPGTTSIPLYFESVGLPGIVTHWIVGHFPVPEYAGDDDTTSDDSLRDNSVIGKTVGVEKPATHLTPQLLLARLRSLTQATCTSPLLWITDSAVCTQLLRDIDQVATAQSSGRGAEAKKALDHYRGLLGVPRQGNSAGRVSSAAYWLLRSNADIVEKAM